jgi:hypothetical protein
MSLKLSFFMSEDGTLILSGLDSFLAGLIRELPNTGTPEPDNEGRLFPMLTGGRQPELDSEWEEFVRPELETQFQLSRDQVDEDCKKIRNEGDAGLVLEIPSGSVLAWIHALNQARLCLATKYHFTETQMENGVVEDGPERLAMFQMQFFGMLQEWLLSVTDSL